MDLDDNRIQNSCKSGDIGPQCTCVCNMSVLGELN